MASQIVKKAGALIYSSGKDVVSSLDIIVKGKVRVYNDYCSIDLPAGSVIGIGENPGEFYLLNYEASDDTTLFSYPYKFEADLVTLLKTNPKLLSMLVAGSVRYAHNLHTSILDSMELARSEYAHIKECEEDYPKAVITAGVKLKNFPEMESVTPPEMMDVAYGWHSDFIDDLYANEVRFRNDVYAIPSIGLGLGLTVNHYALEMRRFIATIFQYLDSLRASTSAFMEEYNSVKSGKAKEDQDILETETDYDISVSDCIGTLNDFGQLEYPLYESFRKNLDEFRSLKDRYSSDDAARKLRRDITNDFYAVYEAVFKESIDTPFYMLPIGIQLFLMFGFVDEKLAGADNTRKLISIANSHKTDKAGRILTMYEWLSLIYKGKITPSKNEFDLDYPAYLRELKRNGEITEAKEKSLLDSPLDKFRFELRNLCTLGNRVTYGRISSFVPVFDKDNVLKPLEMAYLSTEVVDREIDRIRNIDFKAFCRQSVYSNPKIGINSYFLDTEILPYVILMPNVGARAALWQDIDGKKRTTPARMIISIFHTENTEDTFTKLIGEFRWEMCKTEQGVHWNDITDPSLTSMYCDYLQFYRKNSAINQEVKDRISQALKNNSNSFKKVFVSDYLTYIKYESQGALRLNKVAREILFAFCPFPKEIRDKLAENPQFTQFISTYKTKCTQKLKPLQAIQTKLSNAGLAVPKEIVKQADLLNR